jgi:hypothetical protein
MINNIQAGSIVICVKVRGVPRHRCGYGWRAGRIFTVHKIEMCNNGKCILWDKKGHGVYKEFVVIYDIIPEDMFIL